MEAQSLAGAMEEPALRANRGFRRYFAARIVSQLGDQLYVFAVAWFVLDLTRSGFHMAALLAVNALAVMAVAPFGGLVADRVSRKRVLVGTDLLQAAVLLGLLALRQGGLLTVGTLYAGTVLLGLCSAVFSPAANAIVPGLVGPGRVPEAVAAGQAAANFCTIAGMLLGGALYRLIGIGGVLLLNAASNLVSAALEARLPAAPPAAAAPAAAGPREGAGALRRFAAQMREGLSQVRADRTVSALLLVNTVFTLAVLPIAMVYMPWLFNVILGASPLQAAAAQAATWAGIAVGSAAAARLLPRRPHRPPHRGRAGGAGRPHPADDRPARGAAAARPRRDERRLHAGQRRRGGGRRPGSSCRCTPCSTPAAPTRSAAASGGWRAPCAPRRWGPATSWRGFLAQRLPLGTVFRGGGGGAARPVRCGCCGCGRAQGPEAPAGAPEGAPPAPPG